MESCDFFHDIFFSGPDPISYAYPRNVVYLSKANCADDIRAAFFGIKRRQADACSLANTTMTATNRGIYMKMIVGQQTAARHF